MAENFVDIEQQREGRGFWYWLAFLLPPIWVSVSVSSVCKRLLQFCADRFPHPIDQDQIEIISDDDMNWADAQEVLSDGSNINFTEVRLQTLAKVKGSELTKINLWKVAVEDYSETFKMSQNRIYKIEEEMRSVKNEIYQVVGFFSAFQGLLITAAAQSILLRCNNVGFHLALSAFATAVAVFGIRQKIKAMESMRASIIDMRREMMVTHGRLSHLKLSGINLSFDSLDNYGNSIHYHRRRRAFPRLKEILVSYETWLVVSVIAFGGLCMVAMRQIVCNPGYSLPSN